MVKRTGDKLDWRSPAFAARQRRHRHNGLLGSLGMAMVFVQDVLKLDSTTDEAKAIAVRIEQDLEFLKEALATRKDPQP